MTVSTKTSYRFHDWVRPVNIAVIPAELVGRVAWVYPRLLAWFQEQGHIVQNTPTDETDVIITTAVVDHPIDREASLFMQGKRRFNLRHRPHILTLVDVPLVDFKKYLHDMTVLATRSVEQAKELQFIGLGPEAAEVLHSQAQREPLVAFGRYLQSQAKSMRVQAFVGDSEIPSMTLHFDLAGSHAVTDFTNEAEFIDELGKRLVTALCTRDINQHIILEDGISARVWRELQSADAMLKVGEQFTKYNFFTDPVSVVKLLGFRGVGETISAHYSEGCYATYEPRISSLLTTATGSARFVDKRSIQRDEIALVAGIKPDKTGAYVMPVEDKITVVPSVEAVELFGICEASGRQTITLPEGEFQVPMARSVVHGHVGVDSYDPTLVEHVELSDTFTIYPVSCGTDVLARETAKAFASSQALKDPTDPRQVVFLEQPCHGVLVVEKWQVDKPPFAVLEAILSSGALKMTKQVPQGEFAWEQHDGRMVKHLLHELPH
jgi:hypothetical protein